MPIVRKRYPGWRRRFRPWARMPILRAFNLRRLFLSRIRHWWIWAIALLGLVVFIVEIGELAREDEVLTDEALHRILRQHGIEESERAAGEDLEWFGQYLSRLRHLLRHSKHIEKSDEERERERLANLNKMDMPTHKVHGIPEPCLTLLPDKEIEALQLPPPSDSPIKRLTYFRVDEDFVEIENSVGMVEGQKGRSLELDMFAGKQTWGERAESFKVKSVMEVHCGFAGAHCGFDVTAEDREFMNGCQVVVSTCTFGAGDEIAQPMGMTNATLAKVCFVAFWDNITLAVSAEAGMVPDPSSHTLGHWRIIVVENLPFVDNRRNGKIPKLLAHRLFPNARFSIWVDAKSQFRRDPLGVLEALLWRPKAVMAISEHGARACIFHEGEAIVGKHKATPDEVAVQMYRYRLEGIPVNATFDGHKALAEASVIIREHTSLTNLFMCLWFNEIVRFSARDQLSFAYVLRRLEILHIHMFPSCTRKALVNNLGHKRKPKVLLEMEKSRSFFQ